jgi:hypothetical protein
VGATVHDPENIFEDAGHTVKKRAPRCAPRLRARVGGASRSHQASVLSLALDVLKTFPSHILVPGPHFNLLVTRIGSSPVIITDVRSIGVMAILTTNV